MKKCWENESEIDREGAFLLLTSSRLPGLRVLLQKAAKYYRLIRKSQPSKICDGFVNCALYKSD